MARATILCVLGTRPEAIKLAPLVLALRRHPRLTPLLVATAQHRDLLDRALADFGLRADIDLDLMGAAQHPAALLGAAIPRLAAIVADAAPAAVVVQGDTTTALAAAHAAHLAQVPLVHIEAGLRSGDRAAPFPEEGNRRVIAQLADLHFAPTPAARDALLAEGIAAATIHVTGNTGIDALRLIETRDPAARLAAAATLPRLDPARALLVVTAHRRESHGAPLARIVAALADLAATLPVEIVVPVHPHPAVRAAFAPLAATRHVHLIAPLGYAAFVALLGRAAVVLTDSGGVQEEAPALGVPILVLRDVTERCEGLGSGNARLIGTTRTGIVAAVGALLADHAAHARMSEAALPYGDGDATPRIVAVLDRAFGVGGGLSAVA